MKILITGGAEFNGDEVIVWDTLIRYSRLRNSLKNMVDED